MRDITPNLGIYNSLCKRTAYSNLNRFEKVLLMVLSITRHGRSNIYPWVNIYIGSLKVNKRFRDVILTPEI
jgi:hypothetical protein